MGGGTPLGGSGGGNGSFTGEVFSIIAAAAPPAANVPALDPPVRGSCR